MLGLRGHHDPLLQVANGHPVTKDHPRTGEEVPDPAGAVSRAPGLDIDLMRAREAEAIKVIPGARWRETMNHSGDEEHPGARLGDRHQCPHPEAGQTERPVRGQERSRQLVS